MRVPLAAPRTGPVPVPTRAGTHACRHANAFVPDGGQEQRERGGRSTRSPEGPGGGRGPVTRHPPRLQPCALRGRGAPPAARPPPLRLRRAPSRHSPPPRCRTGRSGRTLPWEFTR